MDYVDGTRRRLIHGSFSIFVNNASMIGRMVLGTGIGIGVSELFMRLFEDKLLHPYGESNISTPAVVRQVTFPDSTLWADRCYS